MGKLLSLLARDDPNCCTPKNYDVFLDFENATPTETEREVYDEVERVLRESESVLEEIQCYKVSLSTHSTQSTRILYVFDNKFNLIEICVVFFMHWHA